MSDKSNWKNKNRDILLKNLPSWDKDANVLPVLKREAIDAEIAVVKSTPMNDNIMALRAEIPMNKNVKAATLERSSGLIVFSPTFT